MNKLFFKILLTSFFTIFAMNVSAADTSERLAQADQQIEEIKLRLNLTEKQTQQVTPILEKSMKKREETLKNYGIDLENHTAKPSRKMGFREAFQLKNEMGEIRSQTLTELENVLTEEQLDEYETIQEEIASKIRSKIRARR